MGTPAQQPNQKVEPAVVDPHAEARSDFMKVLSEISGAVPWQFIAKIEAVVNKHHPAPAPAPAEPEK